MTQPAPISPYHAPLMAIVDQIYARSPARVPKTLEVCQCPVCMTPETRAQIIATPVRDLTAAHLSEYRNSAHGVPKNPDDLRAMLPRYLDLIAQDAWGDNLGIAAELTRFGDGRVTHAPLFDPTTDALLNQWAHLMILHTGWSEIAAKDTDFSLFGLTEVLLVGGWPPHIITAALDDLFGSDDGTDALHLFLYRIGDTLSSTGNFQTWSLHNYRPEAIPALADWMNDLLLRPDVQSHLLSPTIIAQDWADPLFMIAGNITHANFFVPR
jgi:hypothetical protein